MCADRALPFLQHSETPGMPRDPRTSYCQHLDHTVVCIWALDGRSLDYCPMRLAFLREVAGHYYQRLKILIGAHSIHPKLSSPT